MATDQEIRDSGLLYVPKQKYLRDPFNLSTPPPPPPPDGGITNTNAFNNSDNNFNPAGNDFKNNTNVLGLRTPGSDFASSGSYVTNRTNSGSMLPGAEEEDNFLQKILKAGGRGIAAMIPGAGMLTSVADKFDRFDDLNPLDQEFINSQMSGYEQNIHGTQNLPQQDRYGYNKRSALGNYSELIDERVKIAEDFYAKKGYYRPIDEYYMDKSKDKNTIQSQMDMNDKVRNHIINQKAQSGPAINNPFSKEYSGNTESPNYTPTGPNQPDPPQDYGQGAADQATQDSYSDGQGGYAGDSTEDYGGGEKDGGFIDGSNRRPFNSGGRAGYFFGGRVNYKIGGVVHPDGRKGFFQGALADTKEGKSMSPGTDASGGFRGGDNDGGASDNPPVTVVNNNPIDISTITKSVGDYEIPYGVEALMADKGRFKAVINPDEILDKNLGAEFTYDNGPFSIGAYADMDGDKSLNANYTRNNSNYSFDLNDGGGQLKFTRTFANGGLASIL